jgi:hypothetical protein
MCCISFVTQHVLITAARRLRAATILEADSAQASLSDVVCVDILLHVSCNINMSLPMLLLQVEGGDFTWEAGRAPASLSGVVCVHIVLH